MDSIHLASALSRLRARQPLVHNITNFVVMNTTANALLAIGTSPAMVHAVEEVEDFVPIASSLVINIGTLSAPWVAAMERAAATAQAKSIPWVLDPVAVGATRYRTETVRKLLAHKPTVIRGNASEIMAIAGAASSGRGVEQHARIRRRPRRRCASRPRDRRRGRRHRRRRLCQRRHRDGRHRQWRRDAHPAVTGTGCSVTALVGAFLGAGLAPFEAAVAGLASMAVAAELAMAKSNGPGSFQVALLDALHSIDDATLVARARLS